jgi:error-prone DNA polymerase
MSGYAELAVTSNFSFLRGASHPEELVATAAVLGLAGLGIADRNSLAGVVRAHVAGRETNVQALGLRVLTGCRLVFRDGTPDVLAYPRDRAGYGRLVRLLTLGNRRAAKGQCLLDGADLLDHAQGLQLAVLPESTAEPAVPARPLEQVLPALAEAVPRAVWLAAPRGHDAHPRRRLAALARQAARFRLPLLAVGDVLYHAPERRPLQDVVTCIRLGCTLDEAGRRLAPHAERYLKPAAEQARLFRAVPQAVAETLRFMDGIGFSLDQLRYEYPEEERPGFASPQEALVHLTWEGARARYPGGLPHGLREVLEKEFALIAELGYAPYFLTVHDIVRFARERGILCQGRGSAANSAVCFCLGITEVDPAHHDLLFERFLSNERREPPDIDVDFEHERREEVMQHIYERYGRERAGLAASVITYRSRSAIREVGKVFGLSQDTVAALSGTVWGWSSGGVEEGEVRRIGLDPGDHRLGRALALARELAGFPRHLSQHTGGFVITRSRLDEVIPIGNAAMADRTVVEWDKDDLDALGILKIDILALGMLSCLRRAFALLERHYGERRTLATLPFEDPAVYRMIQRADTLGVFQIESRAQMSMLPRLKPARFYDLVIEVAIVRPGPIQGDMVHPYLRRREGREKVVYPSPAPAFGPPDELEKVLGKTLGVPLFQEQAMRIAIVAAGFTPAEADRLRRAMATFRRVGTIGTFHAKMVEGMTRRGYDAEFADRCFRQIEGFGEYGFPESHAASFALLVYASCWVKCRYPDVFAAALLNAQPMGFYATAQIVRDAEDHGIAVRPVDINASAWDATLEPATRGPLHRRHASMGEDIHGHHAIRLGLREVKGLGEAAGRAIAAARGEGYDSIRHVWLASGVEPQALERLAEADAFRSLGLERREALWAIRGLRRVGDKDDLPLFAAAVLPAQEPDANLPSMPPGAEVIADYRHLGLSLRAHPVSFVRGVLAERGMVATGALADGRAGREVTVAGLVLVRQRPGTAKGVIFMTLEDESGTANIIIWPKVFERFRPLVLGSRFCAIRGRLQNERGVTHVVAEHMEDLTPLLGSLLGESRVGRAALAPADHVVSPLPSAAGATMKPAKRAKIAALLREEPGLLNDLGGLARADEVRRPQEDPRQKRVRPRDRVALRVDEAQTSMEHAMAASVLPKGRNFH